MNKSELARKMAERMNISAKDATVIVDTLLGTISDALAEGRHVEIRGFGSFSVKEYEGYEGRNPKTGEKTRVNPKKLPVFKVGNELKEKVDKEK